MYGRFFNQRQHNLSARLYIIDILWGEISAKYCLLLINNRFCHFKQKAIVLISIVMITEFEEKWSLAQEFYSLAKFQTDLTDSFPYIKLLIFHCF